MGAMSRLRHGIRWRADRLLGRVESRLSRVPGIRWLLIPHLYHGPLSHSEKVIRLMRDGSCMDESYWAGMLRKYAHMVDKGLHSGDFSKGRGKTAYSLAKEALAHIGPEARSTDAVVAWAAERIRLYETFQSSESPTGVSGQYQEAACSYESLLDVMTTRRSIRRYVERPVQREVVERIAAVVDLAPTSCHRQPARICATNNPDIVRECMHLHIGAACFTDIYAPLYLAFCADARLYTLPDELFSPVIDVSLGVQNCLLAAHALGLSLTPLRWAYQGQWQEERLREILGIPAYCQVIVGVVGGYPDGGAETPVRKRPELVLKE